MWTEAEKFLKNDPYIGQLIKIWGPCRIKKVNKSDYFENICGNIVGQQLSGKAADTIFARFKTVLDGNVSADSIIKISPQTLRDCGLSWSKVGFLKDLSEKTLSGDLKIYKLDKLDDEELITELIKVKGIGSWTAEMFLMFSLARPDIFPVNDLGIKKGFEKTTGLTWDMVESPKLAEKWWSPYRTVASWYLWRSLENRDRLLADNG